MLDAELAVADPAVSVASRDVNAAREVASMPTMAALQVLTVTHFSFRKSERSLYRKARRASPQLADAPKSQLQSSHSRKSVTGPEETAGLPRLLSSRSSKFTLLTGHCFQWPKVSVDATKSFQVTPGRYRNRSSGYFVHSRCLVHNRRLKFQIFRLYGEYFRRRRNVGKINQPKERRYP